MWVIAGYLNTLFFQILRYADRLNLYDLYQYWYNPGNVASLVKSVSWYCLQPAGFDHFWLNSWFRSRAGGLLPVVDCPKMCQRCWKWLRLGESVGCPGDMVLLEKVIKNTSSMVMDDIILEHNALSNSLKCWDNRLNNIVSVSNACQVVAVSNTCQVPFEAEDIL